MIGASATRMMAKLGSVAAAVAMLGGAPAWAQGEDRLFATPEEAVAALTRAVEEHDRAAVAAIVEPAFAELIQGQGAEANAADRERFLEAARRATVLRPDGDDRRVLEVGLAA
jgi:hypothetical protein